jgi:L-methionine (R)-S-oxide reductase
MAENLVFSKTKDRSVIYQELIPQIQNMIQDETDLVANQANIVAALRQAFDFFWVGFYWVKDQELVLGPFQGPIACTRIAFHRGVCGHAFTTRRSVLVPDVDQFPGHIACSSASRSEVVIPVFNRDRSQVLGVLDVDSDRLNDFTEADVAGLEALMKILEKKL